MPLPPDPTSDFLTTGKTPAAPPAAPEKITRNPSLLHDVTSLGAPIVGGWRGITELGSRLLSGNPFPRLPKLPAPLRMMLSTGIPTRRRWSETFANRGAAYPELTPGVLLAKAADIAGEKTADVTGSPAAGATVKAAVQMLPMLLGPRGMTEGGARPAPRPARARLR